MNLWQIAAPQFRINEKHFFIQFFIFVVFVLRRFAALMLHIPGKIIHSATSDARLIDFMNVASQAVGRLKKWIQNRGLSMNKKGNSSYAVSIVMVAAVTVIAAQVTLAHTRLKISATSEIMPVMGLRRQPD